MIYLPRSNFVFIHIPRTAGNAITRTLAIEKIPYDEVVMSTMHCKPIARHAFLSQFVDTFNLDKEIETNVVVINRPTEDIIYSSYILWQHATPLKNPGMDQPEYNSVITAAKTSFEMFVDVHWSKILGDKETALERWIDCQYDFLKVHVVEYDNLEDQWPHICALAKCKKVPNLRNWDYQKEYFKNNK